MILMITEFTVETAQIFSVYIKYLNGLSADKFAHNS